MDIQFSHHCGENIELSEEKHRASWTHRFSGGIAFSSQQLQNNNNLKLDLAGTGHAYVGVVTRDPSTIINMRETLARGVLVAKEMKVHKRLGAINITPNIKDGSSCIRFECCGETKILDCSTNSHVWLFVYIKFGDLIAILHCHTITATMAPSFANEHVSSLIKCTFVCMVTFHLLLFG
jgi:hypothetical protein